jgi:hypothetical protein
VPSARRPDSYGNQSLDPGAAPACLEHLKTTGEYDRLRYFTTRQAALDVARAIEAVRSLRETVFLWGGSYGTQWAHRVFQVAVGALDGVLFDG